MIPKLIGVTGPARSGKDSFGLILNKHFGYHIDSFAAPIRRAVADILCLTLEELAEFKDIMHPVLGTTPRRMMQTLGTEWGRDIIGSNIWVESMELRILNGPIHDCRVITDVRFENEVNYIRSRDGVIVHMHRTDAFIGLNDSAHRSEIPVRSISKDWHIYNIDTLERLTDNVLEIFKTYGAEYTRNLDQFTHDLTEEYKKFIEALNKA